MGWDDCECVKEGVVMMLGEVLVGVDSLLSMVGWGVSEGVKEGVVMV